MHFLRVFGFHPTSALEHLPPHTQSLAKQVLKECGGEMEKNKGEDSTGGTANSPRGTEVKLVELFLKGIS